MKLLARYIYLSPSYRSTKYIPLLNPSPTSKMPPPSQNIPLASTLVARFLRTNNYTQTLKAFLQEAGLPSDAGEQGGKDDATNWTIENVIEEKKAFDQSKNFERYGDNDKDKDVWTVPGLYNTFMPR